MQVGAEEFLHQTQWIRVHAIDFVDPPEFAEAMCAAVRASAGSAKQEQIPLIFEFLLATFPAPVNGRVPDSFDEGPVDAMRFPAALEAVRHFPLLYSP
jgi:hypothetical protein